MSRVVSWFSCGAASAVATKLAKSQYTDREFVIARCVIDEEHPDNDRFARDCEDWFGQKIVNLTSKEYGSSIEALFDRRKGMSFIWGAPCTLHLKKEVRQSFQRFGDTHVFGYSAEEQGRWDKFLDANNIDAVAPLLERGVLHSEALAMIEQAGIRLPEMYQLGYHHNNCIGCVKSSGAGYWNKVRTDFPLVFHRRAAQSRALGVRLVKVEEQRIYLDDLEPGTGRYADEPEIQCGIFCEMAQKEYTA